MKIDWENIKRDRLVLVIVGFALTCLVFGFTVGWLLKGKSKSSFITKVDTVFVEKVITKAEEVKKLTKPLPVVNTYKVSDWVCAWDRWSGVIISIKWNEAETLVLYNVQTYSDQDGWNSQNWYYETELSLGKCP